jgi:predicted RNase H-like HicB family nuclease
MTRAEAVPVAKYSYRILLEPTEERGFVVTCSALRGLVTEGDTLEEARAMARDAIQGYLELLQEDGLPIPESDEATVVPIAEAVKVKLVPA